MQLLSKLTKESNLASKNDTMFLYLAYFALAELAGVLHGLLKHVFSGKWANPGAKPRSVADDVGRLMRLVNTIVRIRRNLRQIYV